MDVFAYPIVQHDYSEESLMQVFSVNEKKSGDFEWNSDSNIKHAVGSEIENHDITYSIENIENPRDEYGFCFINEQKCENGNYLYSIDGAIIDYNISITVIERFVTTIIRFLLQKNRNTYEDRLRIDGIRCEGEHYQIYQLAPQHFTNTAKMICEDIKKAFLQSRDGFVPLTEEQEKRLKEIADKMNNATQ